MSTKKTKTRLKPAFARHETFHLRDGWLYKGMDSIRKDGSSLFTKDAHHNLGIGINMR